MWGSIPGAGHLSRHVANEGKESALKGEKSKTDLVPA